VEESRWEKTQIIEQGENKQLREREEQQLSITHARKYKSEG
jgi:hypothetical protein